MYCKLASYHLSCLSLAETLHKQTLITLVINIPKFNRQWHSASRDISLYTKCMGQVVKTQNIPSRLTENN